MQLLIILCAAFFAAADNAFFSYYDPEDAEVKGLQEINAAVVGLEQEIRVAEQNISVMESNFSEKFSEMWIRSLKGASAKDNENEQIWREQSERANGISIEDCIDQGPALLNNLTLTANLRARNCMDNEKTNFVEYIETMNVKHSEVFEELREIRQEARRCVNIHSNKSRVQNCLVTAANRATVLSKSTSTKLTRQISNLNTKMSSFEEALAKCSFEKIFLSFDNVWSSTISYISSCVQKNLDVHKLDW